MDVSVKLDTKAFEAAIVRAATALGRDLPEVYEEEADLLMRSIVKATYPKSKSQGNRRVLNDIKFTAVGVHARFLNILKQRFGSGPYAGLYRTRNGETLVVAYAKIIESPGELRAWHYARKHPITGRVSKPPRTRHTLDNPTKAFVPKGVLESYIRAEQKHVGAAKGGWAKAQLSVSRGRPLPSWITNHQKLGGVLKNFQPRIAGQQTFIASNSSPFAKRYRDANAIVKHALRIRQKALPKKVETQLKLRYKQNGFTTLGSDIIQNLL